MSKTVASQKKASLIAGIIGFSLSAAIIALSTIAMIANGGKNFFIGTWKIESMEEFGQSYNLDQLKEAGLDNYKFEFYDDNTGVMTTSNGDESFVYDLEQKTFSAAGETYDLNVSRNILTVSPTPDITMVYKKY